MFTLMLILTIIHLTAFKLLDAVEFVTCSLEKPCQVISIVAATQTLVIERYSNIFGYASSVCVREADWFATLPQLYVVEPVGSASAIHSLHKIPVWAHCPSVGTTGKRIK